MAGDNVSWSQILICFTVWKKGAFLSFSVSDINKWPYTDCCVIHARGSYCHLCWWLPGFYLWPWATDPLCPLLTYILMFHWLSQNLHSHSKPITLPQDLGSVLILSLDNGPNFQGSHPWHSLLWNPQCLLTSTQQISLFIQLLSTLLSLFHA